MRSQLPVFEKDIKDNYILKNKYAMKQIQNANFNFNSHRTYNNSLQQRRPLSALSNIINCNPNGTHAHENYEQKKNKELYRNRVPESARIF